MTAQWIFVILCLSMYAGQLFVLGSIFPPILPEGQQQGTVTSLQHEVQMPLANLATTPEVVTVVDVKLNARNGLPAEQSQASRMESGGRAAGADRTVAVEQKSPGESLTTNTAKTTDTNNKTLLSAN